MPNSFSAIATMISTSSRRAGRPSGHCRLPWHTNSWSRGATITEITSAPPIPASGAAPPTYSEMVTARNTTSAGARRPYMSASTLRFRGTLGSSGPGSGNCSRSTWPNMSATGNSSNSNMRPTPSAGHGSNTRGFAGSSCRPLITMSENVCHTGRSRCRRARENIWRRCVSIWSRVSRAFSSIRRHTASWRSVVCCCCWKRRSASRTSAAALLSGSPNAEIFCWMLARPDSYSVTQRSARSRSAAISCCTWPKARSVGGSRCQSLISAFICFSRDSALVDQVAVSSFSVAAPGAVKGADRHSHSSNSREARSQALIRVSCPVGLNEGNQPAALDIRLALSVEGLRL